MRCTHTSKSMGALGTAWAVSHVPGTHEAHPRINIYGLLPWDATTALAVCSTLDCGGAGDCMGGESTPRYP